MESLALQTANRLGSDLGAWNEHLLPTIRQMCNMYDVSLRTMYEAVQILKARGLIDTQRGRRLRKPHHGTARSPSSQSSADRLYQSLLSRILGGTYRQGAGFPKVSVLTREFGISPRTVQTAVSRLESESLIHSHGRGWRVGHHDSVTQSFRSKSLPPVIILLTHKESSWSDLKQGGRERKFSLAFEREADLAGVQIVPAFVSPDTRLKNIFSTGADQILQCIASLGARYRGTLVAARIKEFSGLYELIERLLHKGQFVVWFDRYHEFDSRPIRSNLFLRATDSVESVYTICLEFLRNLGHRHISVPLYFDRPGIWGREADGMLRSAAQDTGISWNAPRSPFESENWQSEINNARTRVRKYLLSSGRSQLWKRIDIDPMSLPVNLLKRFLKIDRSKDLDSLNLFLKQTGGESKPDISSTIFKTAALFGLFMLDSSLQQGATAIFAPTEFDAYHYYLWLRITGLSVPRDFSLIAAENLFMQPLYPLPITTIDFGYDRLGHDTFHAILGDRPQRRKGNLVLAQPHVVRRGSVEDLSRTSHTGSELRK